MKYAVQREETGLQILPNLHDIFKNNYKLYTSPVLTLIVKIIH